MKTSRTNHFLHRVHQVWNELDRAQRRLFELQTGVRSLPREDGRGGSFGLR